MRVTMIPDKLRIEPVDPKAYNRWQDHEGLVGANEGTRAAWAGWRDQWAREWPMARDEVDAIDGRPLDPMPEGLTRAGRAMGVLSCSRKPILDANERGQWWRFRKRVLSADPDAWGMLWALAAGEDAGIIGARFGCDARYVRNVSALLARWWREAGV